MQSPGGYELLDFGGGARLERFGERIVDRPFAAALGPREDSSAWAGADLRFDRDTGWTGPAVGRGPWPYVQGGIELELRPTEAGQVGLFPEHLEMLPWLRSAVADRATWAGRTRTNSPPAGPAVLNLFAYTGLATVALAEAGAAVTHVDSSRPAVAWARQNAKRSDVGDRPVRWIVDDAAGFTLRELRRGRSYTGVVLDPPSYGHGPDRRPWQIEEDLASLLATAARLLQPGGFVLLTAHTPGFDANRLAELLHAALPNRSVIDSGALRVATNHGRVLELGAFARSSAAP